jgi:hypothetical protein
MFVRPTVHPHISPPGRWTEFQEMLYEFYAAIGQLKFIISNFFLAVVKSKDTKPRNWEVKATLVLLLEFNGQRKAIPVTGREGP